MNFDQLINNLKQLIFEKERALLASADSEIKSIIRDNIKELKLTLENVKLIERKTKLDLERWKAYLAP
jgi:preprotein translocase subunit SecA